MRIRPSALAAAVLLVTACTGGSGSGTSEPGTIPSGASSGPGTADLTIFGAASLAAVLDEIVVAYEAAAPGVAVTVSTDSSAALATQITQGAPADVFLSADPTNPQQLVDAGLVDGEALAYAGNELAIITPIDDPGGIATPFDLARPGVRIIAAGDAVPITRYATELLDNLAASPGAPPDFVAAYAANVASREDNVGAVRTKIALGEGDAAIVYRTDAAASDRVASVEVDDDVNVRATYAGVVVSGSDDLDAAHAFLDWLVGPEGQAILAAFGFLPPAS